MESKNSTILLVVQTASVIANLVSRTTSGEVITSAAPAGQDPRTFQRAVAEFLGSRASDLSHAVDANGQPQRSRILSELKSWASRKRIVVELCEVVGSEYLENDAKLVLLTDNRGRRTWKQLKGDVLESLIQLSDGLGRKLWLVPSGEACDHAAKLLSSGRHLELEEYFEFLDQAIWPTPYELSGTDSIEHISEPKQKGFEQSNQESYLDELEKESISILREAVATSRNPCMLFSMGKDSMVMLRLAQKAFAPTPLPFPLVVIDTRWKFQDMYRFRNFIESQPTFVVKVHINPDAIARNVNPFEFGSATHTQITKTEALRQVLDENGFDIIFGGGRRDEEKSRAKERIFSVRGTGHSWNPRDQRPELWNVYNTLLSENQTMRVFPISNWTELDIWRYIQRERIPLVPLYFAKRRAVVFKNNALLAVDDERMELAKDDKVEFEWVRFRTLGCYPLTGAAYSRAVSIEGIISELEESDTSERISRVIDFDFGASMEQKKREGYF